MKVKRDGLSDRDHELFGELIVLTWKAFLGVVTAIAIAKLAITGSDMVDTQQEILRDVKELKNGTN